MRLQQVVRWDAARREGLLEGREEGFGQTTGDWRWSKRGSRRNSTGGRERPLPDGEASSWGCNDRHPIAPAAPHQRRGPRTEIEQWRLVRSSSCGPARTGITSVEGSRACACGRVWAPRTSAMANRVRWQNPKLFITISSASRSVWRQANPSVPVSQRAREALSKCGLCVSAIAAGKDWPMAAHPVPFY